MTDRDLRVRVLPAIGDIAAAAWDACAGTGTAANPFTRHAFLAALEAPREAVHDQAAIELASNRALGCERHDLARWKTALSQQRQHQCAYLAGGTHHGDSIALTGHRIRVSRRLHVAPWSGAVPAYAVVEVNNTTSEAALG